MTVDNGQMALFNSGDNSDGGADQAVNLHEATRTRYLNYALSVITSRALPDVRDGLKPVQRRILYGMYKDLKLRQESRFLKSARVVGEVMGKYHPHGDQSIYDAMVRMSQSFSLRYPLVDGHGNFGSLDGDPAAAMRYTEVRLRSLSEELIDEINQGTVDFRPTYDGQLEEPIVLPAQVPNLLINGATGIAVGMATNIPPHNISEVIDALLCMIDDPEVGTLKLCEHIRGPDFPTGGEILNSPDELRAIYEKGQGPIQLRGQYTIEAIQRRKMVVITSIPYMVNKSTLIEKIAALIIAKKVPQIVDVRDESTDIVRIVLELKRGAEPEAAMAYLYKHTPLQTNFHVNLTCLVPTENPEISTPQRLGLREMLRAFLDFRLQIVTRRLRFRLEKLQQRIHILDGYAIVFDALDVIIKLIRQSEGKADAARKIMRRFKLDAMQTEAILELKLYRLAKLEILIIQEELAEKRAAAAEIEALLASEGSRWDIVRVELDGLRSTYMDTRRSALVGPQASVAFSATDYILRESTWVIVSRNGLMKRQKKFSQVESIRFPDGDEVGWVLRSDTRQSISFFTQLGSVYVVRVVDIAATTGHGNPVQAAFKFCDGEHLVGVLSSDARLYPKVNAERLATLEAGTPPPPYAISMSALGKAARFPIAAHAEVTTKNGRRYMSLASGDHVVAVHPCREDELVSLASRSGRVMLFRSTDLPIKANAVRGVTGIKLERGDEVLGVSTTDRKRIGLVAYTNRGKKIIVRETSYKPVKKGGRGTIVIRLGKLVRCDKEVQVMKPYQPHEPEEAEEVSKPKPKPKPKAPPPSTQTDLLPSGERS